MIPKEVSFFYIASYTPKFLQAWNLQRLLLLFLGPLAELDSANEAMITMTIPAVRRKKEYGRLGWSRERRELGQHRRRWVLGHYQRRQVPGYC